MRRSLVTVVRDELEKSFHDPNRLKKLKWSSLHRRATIKDVNQFLCQGLDDPYTLLVPTSEGESNESDCSTEAASASVTIRELADWLIHIWIKDFTKGQVVPCLGKINKIRDAWMYGTPTLIVDLRGNPGGDSAEAIKAAKILLPPDKVLMQISRRVDGKQEPLLVRNTSSPEEHCYEELPSGILNFPKSTCHPMVVLIDMFTASAAEILAGALHDNGALLIGENHTLGKGVGQSGLELPKYGLTLWVSWMKFFTPCGYWPGDGARWRYGINPDITVLSGATPSRGTRRRDIQLESAIVWLTCHR